MYLRIDRPCTRQARLLLRRQGDIDFAGDGSRHFTLQGEHVAQFTLEALRPDDFSCGSPDQFGGDSHLVARADDRTFDDRVDLQFPRNRWHRLRVPFCSA